MIKIANVKLYDSHKTVAVDTTNKKKLEILGRHR